MLNELKIGYNHFLPNQSGYVPNAPEIRLRGYTIGKMVLPIILDQKNDLGPGTTSTTSPARTN